MLSFKMIKALLSERSWLRWMVILAVLLPINVVFAASSTLEFETQALDLNTGSMHHWDMLPIDDTTGSDIHIAYHAHFTPHSIFVPHEGVSMAFIAGKGFHSVATSDLSSLVFTTNPVDQFPDSGSTLIIKTAEGAVFKLGNAIEQEESVSFDYQLMQE